MTDPNTDVLTRQKRMDDARLKPAARAKLSLSFATRGTVILKPAKRRNMVEVKK